MAKLPFKRLIVYCIVIGCLVSVWLAGEAGVGPLRPSDRPGIFQVPSDQTSADRLAPLDLEDIPRRSGKKARDEFADALRNLSTDDDGGAPVDDTKSPTPVRTSTPEPAATDTSVIDDGGFVEDGRSIFTGLEQQEGSKVTDPLGGVVVRSKPAVALTPLQTPTDQRLWAGGQARGYTMLSAMQPEARPVVEAQIQTLLASRIRQTYIGVLIDGTFGRDFAYLKEIVARLTSADHSLTLVLYLSNGPTMRKWRETPIDELFSRLDPIEFRQRIRRDQQLRVQFLAVTLQAKEIFDFNRSLSDQNRNVAIVMLEDNLDILAYRSMREIAAEQLGTVASFTRNPCVDCYDGNDDDTMGDAREEHKTDRFSILRRGDGYSLDGVGFQYPSLGGDGLSPEATIELLRESYSKELLYFGLWRHDWQGVKEGVPNKLPSQRVYIPSTPDQQEFEIQLLRTGLIVESKSQ